MCVCKQTKKLTDLVTEKMLPKNRLISISLYFCQKNVLLKRFGGRSFTKNAIECPTFGSVSALFMLH